jgi:hypothetical protein
MSIQINTNPFDLVVITFPAVTVARR